MIALLDTDVLLDVAFCDKTCYFTFVGFDQRSTLLPPLQKRQFTPSLPEPGRVSTFPWKSPCRHWPQWLVIFVSFVRRQGGPGEVGNVEENLCW